MVHIHILYTSHYFYCLSQYSFNFASTYDFNYFPFLHGSPSFHLLKGKLTIPEIELPDCLKHFSPFLYSSGSPGTQRSSCLLLLDLKECTTTPSFSPSFTLRMCSLDRILGLQLFFLYFKNINLSLFEKVSHYIALTIDQDDFRLNREPPASASQVPSALNISLFMWKIYL